MSFAALAVATMATEHLPEWEDDEGEFGFLYPPDDAALDVMWVIYESIGAGVLLRVRSVEWA